MGSLQRIKEHSGKWFVKALLWVLVASFALWGVGDMVTNYTRMRPIAKVGGNGISQDEFGTALQRTVRELQKGSKAPLSGDDIRKTGIPKMVMDSLLNQAAIREEIHRLKLVVSDEQVRRFIQSDPMFQNEKGVYDGRALIAILKQINMSESQFVHDTRLRMLQKQLTGSLASGATLPKKYKQLLYQSIQQKIVFGVVSIPSEKMPLPKAPSEQELQGYYDQNKTQFTHPEVRTLSVLEMDLDHLKSSIKIPEEKISEVFESRKGEFSVPEKREVEELTFADEISAKLAFDEMASGADSGKDKGKGKKKAKGKKGADLSQIAKKYSGHYKNYGAVAKADLPEDFAAEVFGASVNAPQMSKASGPDNRMFRVKSITSSKPANEAEARKQIENELKTQQINDTIFDLRNKVEDALAGGSDYSEIAKTHNLKAYNFDSVARDGKSLDGKVVVPDALKPIILEQSFSIAEKADSQMIDGKEGAFFVVRADKVTSSYVPEFSVIKEKVLKAWQDEKRTQAALSLAESIAKEVKSPAELSKLASASKLSVKVMDPVSFSSVSKDKGAFQAFPAPLLNKIFALKAGRTAFGPMAGSAGALVVHVQSIKPVDLSESKAEYKQFSDNLTKTAQRDVVELYVNHLKEMLGVTINSSIYEAMVGAL